MTGQFVTFDEIAVKIFIYDGMNAQELTDEDREKGYIGYFAAEDGSAIAVQYVNVQLSTHFCGIEFDSDSDIGTSH